MPMYEIYSWAGGGGYFLGEVEVGGRGGKGAILYIWKDNESSDKRRHIS